mgnify:CR=1 FL=1|tara:strand:- start:37 stop:399 length:363 start_codon:yes stop_codon:yes gene_type:complete
MKIINPLLTTNTLPILPRGFDSTEDTVVVFTNEDSGLETTITPDSIGYSSNDLILDIQVPLFKEGQRYSFEVRQLLVPTPSIIFKGTILVTQFNDTNYTINNNEFIVDIDTDSDSIKVYE